MTIQDAMKPRDSQKELFSFFGNSPKPVVGDNYFSSVKVSRPVPETERTAESFLVDKQYRYKPREFIPRSY